MPEAREGVTGAGTVQWKLGRRDREWKIANYSRSLVNETLQMVCAVGLHLYSCHISPSRSNVIAGREPWVFLFAHRIEEISYLMVPHRCSMLLPWPCRRL
jgi:hypothetical protein